MISPTPYTKDYEITDAMFGAFRSEGGPKLFWLLTAYLTVAFSIIFLLTGPPMVTAYGRLIMASMDGAVDVILSEAMKISAYALLMTILIFAANAVVRASFFRCYFFGVDDGLFPVRFGQDEVRQGLAILGYYGLVYLAAIGVGVFIGFTIGFFGALMGENAAAFLVFLMFILMLVLIILIYWFMLILSPAGALTALRGKTHVLAARHVTKGRRWAVFGSILVAGLIGYVVYNILATIGFMAGLSGLMSAELFSAVIAEDSDKIVTLFQDAISKPGFKAGMVLAIVLMSAGMAFYYMIIAGPQAFFTRQWADAMPETDSGAS